MREPGVTSAPPCWLGYREHCYATRMRKTALIACLALLAASALEAQVYRWVDEEGVVHYSDTPHPGAEEIFLPDSSSSSRSTTGFGAQPRTPRNAREEQDGGQTFDYESLTFAAPAPEETLWNIEGELTVRLNLQPALRQGHQVRVYFDGEPRPVEGLQFALQEVYRGTHNLQAEVLNESGQLMIRSEPLRFYVQQTSIANPN